MIAIAQASKDLDHAKVMNPSSLGNDLEWNLKFSNNGHKNIVLKILTCVTVHRLQGVIFSGTLSFSVSTAALSKNL